MSCENFKKLMAYEASAGSGKTVALATRYLALLFLGEAPSSILAATFTNKAAGEMKGRIIKYLRELHAPELEFVLKSVSAQSGLSKEAILELQTEVLENFLISSNSIVTLDSFFVSILRSMALEIGLEPDFDSGNSAMSSRINEEFLRELDRSGLLGELVDFGMVANKKLAGIMEFLNSFYKSDALLPKQKITNLNRDEIEANIKKATNELLLSLKAQKANPRELKQFEHKSPKWLTQTKLFEYDTLSSHSWFKKITSQDTQDIYATLKEYLKLWLEANEEQIIAHTFTLYDHYKNVLIGEAKNSSLLSFDDISFFTYRVMSQILSKDFLYFRLDAHYKHILLDEFQDTSMLQFLLLKPIIDEIVAGDGQSEFRTLFYVGDTKQSLYRFRGGVEELFPFVAQKYGVDVHRMDTNYRSSSLVVSKVNEWFDGAIENFPKAKSRDGVSEGFVRVVSDDEVLNSTIEQIKSLLQNGVDIDDIALLVSSNSDGFELHNRCLQEGIETRLKTKSSLRFQINIARIVSAISFLVYGDRIDIEPLLLQSGKELSDIDFGWFSIFSEPIFVINRVVEEFGCYDDNVPILLDWASGYDDLLEFLEDFSSSDIAVASGSSHGAVIMTVHGSKGLEFEYTIVVDKFKGEKNDTNKFLFATDEGLGIERIYYISTNRENFDNSYAIARENEKRTKEKDRLNLLYVALTRAVKGLVVVQKSKASRFDQLALNELEIGHIEPSHKPHKTESIAKSVKLSKYGNQNSQPQNDKTPISYDAVMFGSALHYALEMIEDFTHLSLENAISLVGYKYGRLLGQQKLELIRDRVTMLLESDEFNKLFVGAVVHRELPLSFDGELKQIDLLLGYDDRFVVIDYKSSISNSSKHKEQVAQYAKAISTIMDKPTSPLIVYLLEDCVRIDG